MKLHQWWVNQAQDELLAMAPKVKEYSAHDLEVMGKAMEALGVPKGSGVEAAIAFYALGKIARIVGALGEGAEPSEDSWHDLAVYSRMALRVRDCGSWPGEVD